MLAPTDVAVLALSSTALSSAAGLGTPTLSSAMRLLLLLLLFSAACSSLGLVSRGWLRVGAAAGWPTAGAEAGKVLTFDDGLGVLPVRRGSPSVVFGASNEVAWRNAAFKLIAGFTYASAGPLVSLEEPSCLLASVRGCVICAFEVGTRRVVFADKGRELAAAGARTLSVELAVGRLSGGGADEA